MYAQPHEHIRPSCKALMQGSQVQPQDTEARAFRGLDRITIMAFKESEIAKSRNLRYSINSDP